MNTTFIQKIEAFNQQVLALDPTSDDYSLVHSPQALTLTEQKLDTWKRAADAGALISGANSCRYLIFIKDGMPDGNGFLKPIYGFINIDDAGWNAVDVSFISTDELIEWFAFNVENPIVEVIPSSLVEKLLSRDKVMVQKDEYYTVMCISPDRQHEWFAVPTALALETELVTLEEAGYPTEKITIITPEGERLNYLEMMNRFIWLVISGKTILSLTQIDEEMAHELKGHDISHLPNPYEEVVDDKTVIYSVHQCPNCQITHRVEADLQKEHYRKNPAGFFEMNCFDC